MSLSVSGSTVLWISLPCLLFSVLLAVQGEGIILKRPDGEFGLREWIGAVTIGIGGVGIGSVLTTNAISGSLKYASTPLPFLITLLFLIPSFVLSLFSLILIFLRTSIPSAQSRCTIGLDIAWVWGGGNVICLDGEGSRTGWIVLSAVKCLFVAIVGGLWSGMVWERRADAMLEMQVKEAEAGYAVDDEKASFASARRKDASLESLKALQKTYNQHSHFLTQKDVSVLASHFQNTPIHPNNDFDAPLPTSPRATALKFGFNYTPIVFNPYEEKEKEKAPDYSSNDHDNDRYSTYDSVHERIPSDVHDLREVERELSDQPPQLPPIQVMQQQQGFAGWLWQSLFQQPSAGHPLLQDQDQNEEPSGRHEGELVTSPILSPTVDQDLVYSPKDEGDYDLPRTPRKSYTPLPNPHDPPVTPPAQEPTAYDSYDERVDRAPRSLSRKGSRQFSDPGKEKEKASSKPEGTVAGTPYNELPPPDFPPVVSERHRRSTLGDHEVTPSPEAAKPKVFVSMFNGGSLVRKLSTIQSLASESTASVPPKHAHTPSSRSSSGGMHWSTTSQSQHSMSESVREEFESVVGRVKRQKMALDEVAKREAEERRTERELLERREKRKSTGAWSQRSGSGGSLKGERS